MTDSRMIQELRGALCALLQKHHDAHGAPAVGGELEKAIKRANRMLKETRPWNRAKRQRRISNASFSKYLQQAIDLCIARNGRPQADDYGLALAALVVAKELSRQ